jgi:Na+-transporting methylmalonyl-CoA/oxaloacetate decarboxylase gamma subunit
MESQTDWAKVINIMVTGFGAVFIIMMILAGTTWLVGKVFQKYSKQTNEEKSGT